MKLHRKLFALLLSAAMLLTLCSCSEKVKPVKINTKDYSREILLRSSGEGLEIIHSDKSSQKIQTGEPLKSDDSIRVGKGAELILDVDDDKQIPQRYKVMSIPSLVLFKDGQAKEKVTGLYNAEQLSHYFERKLAE